MANSKKKATQQLIKESDALLVDRASFAAKLIDRIKAGNDLIARSVTNIPELEKNESDYYKWDNYNSEYLKQSFNNENNEYRGSYDHVNSFLSVLGGGYDNTPNERLRKLKDEITNKVEFLDRLLEKVELLKSQVESPPPIKSNNEASYSDKSEIFIVHGHNVAIQQSVARVIEKLGLIAVILHEQANAGRTLIEKFEANSDVGFAIILLTDDDEGKLKTDIQLNSRARQNVVLELGYFIGKLGRERVLPLYSQDIELPSDIHGLLYVPIDKADTWKFALVRELKAAGYSVDANALL